MKSYFTLLVKKQLKNPYLWIPFMIAVVCLGVMYQEFHAFSLQNGYKDYDYGSADKNKILLTGMIAQMDTEDELYPFVDEQIKANKNERETDAKAFCLLKIKDLRFETDELLKIADMHDDIVQNVLNQIEYYKYFVINDVPYIHENDYATGISFLIHLLNFFLPCLMLFILGYVLSVQNGNAFHISLHKYGLLPIHNGNMILIDIISGFVTGILCIIGLICLSLMLGKCFDSFGSMDFPIQYDETYISFRSVIPALILLTVMGILFLTCLIKMLSEILKNPMVILLAYCVLLFSLRNNPMLPFRYLFPLKIVESSKLSVYFGCLSLGIGSALCLLLSVIVEKFLYIELAEKHKQGKNEISCAYTFVYSRFLFKRLQSRKVIRILLLSGLLLAGYRYYRNYNSYQMYTFEEYCNNQISILQMMLTPESLDNHPESFDHADYDDPNLYAYYVLTNVKNAYDKGEYQKAYSIYLAFERYFITVSPSADSKVTIKRYAFLETEDLPDEPHHLRGNYYSVSGVNFLLECNEEIYPFFFSVLYCFVLSILYTSFYHEKILFATMIPLIDRKRENQIALVAVMFMAVSFMLFQLLPFIIGTVFYKPGSLRFPYMCYENYVEIFKHVYEILPGTFVLYCLSFSVLLQIVKLFSKITKNAPLTFLLSIAVCSGTIFFLKETEPLWKIAHLLPFTYFYCIQAVSGELSNNLGNLSVTFSYGCRTCIISIVFLSIMNKMIKN